MNIIGVGFLLVPFCYGAAVHPEAKLPFLHYCSFYNYSVEAHSVLTEDGYILALCRIQRKAYQTR